MRIHEVTIESNRLEAADSHFAIITYAIPPAGLQSQIPPGHSPRVIRIDGSKRALVSVVPFLDRDFRYDRLAFKRWSFAQPNYRVYVTHRGEVCAWFIGPSPATSVLIQREVPFLIDLPPRCVAYP